MLDTSRCPTGKSEVGQMQLQTIGQTLRTNETGNRKQSLLFMQHAGASKSSINNELDGYGAIH